MDSGKNMPRQKQGRSEKEKIVGFAPQILKAPFSLRGAAFLADYILILSIPLIWLTLSKFFADPSSSPGLGLVVWLIVLIAVLLDFAMLPLLTGKTLGKMLFGLSIVKSDGTPIDLKSIFLRNFLGYALSFLTLGIGFLFAAFNSRGRALHDMLSGTMVVHGKKVRVD